MNTDDKVMPEELKKFDTFFDSVQEKDIILKHSVTVEWLERVPNIKDKLIKENSDTARQKNIEFIKAQHANCTQDIKNFMAAIDAKGMPTTSADYNCQSFNPVEDQIKTLAAMAMDPNVDVEDMPPCLQKIMKSEVGKEIRDLINSGKKPQVKVVNLSSLLNK